MHICMRMKSVALVIGYHYGIMTEKCHFFDNCDDTYYHYFIHNDNDTPKFHFKQ